MATKVTPTNVIATASKVSWLPLVIIVIAQLQMGINVNALPVSLGPIVEDLNAPATAVSTALVLYSLAVAAFVMLGAKLGKLFGERLVFQGSAVGHGVAMLIMALSRDTTMMNMAQLLAGLAAALLVPTLVVLIAANYHGKQQSQALGILASIPAISSGLAFVIAGFIATALTWRLSFGLIFIQSLLVLLLSFRLTPVPRQKDIKIDFVGVVLSALAITLILFAFNNINRWGAVLATPEAPFNVLGLSPVPIFIVAGIVLGQAFFMWIARREAQGKTPLLAREVLNSSEERNAVIAFLVAGALSSAISFLIPLYIQIVQGSTPLFTSVAIVPYALAVAAAAILSVRLYGRMNPALVGSRLFHLECGRLRARRRDDQPGLGHAPRDHRVGARRDRRRHHADAALQRPRLRIAEGVCGRCRCAARGREQRLFGVGRGVCRGRRGHAADRGALVQPQPLHLCRRSSTWTTSVGWISSATRS